MYCGWIVVNFFGFKLFQIALMFNLVSKFKQLESHKRSLPNLKFILQVSSENECNWTPIVAKFETIFCRASDP